jgi:hypothetical protein
MVDTHFQETNRDVMRLQRRALLARLVKFQSPSTRRSIIQLTSTVLAYAATVAGMYALCNSRSGSPWPCPSLQQVWSYGFSSFSTIADTAPTSVRRAQTRSWDGFAAS